MGYRSDVALALTRTGYRKLNTLISCTNSENDKTATLDFFKNASLHHKDKSSKAELWYWEAVKWYDDFPEVEIMERFMEMPENLKDYRFIRIGEDEDDVETRGDFFDEPFDLYVERKMHISM